MSSPAHIPRRLLLAGTCLLGLLVAADLPEAEAANWRDLTGRVAPDLTFEETTNGLRAGTRLSSFRGQRVVLLVFWLRDCRQCERELPKVQGFHERWGGAGLQVITVVHKHPLSEVLPIMGRRGWNFPLARDPAGRLASVYGAGRRPGYYIVGIDGRVKASNGMPDAVLQTELGRWRLNELVNELGPLPAELNDARNLVYAPGENGRGDYGAALRSAEAVAAAAGTPESVGRAVDQLRVFARGKMKEERERAEAWYRRGYVERARKLYRGLVASYAGSSLAGQVRALYETFVARVGGR